MPVRRLLVLPFLVCLFLPATLQAEILVVDGNALNVSTTSAECAAVAVHEHVPYVAWCDNGNILVKHWDGNSWAPDGGALNMATGGGWPSAKFVKGLLYVAWAESGHIFVKHWDGTLWTQDSSTQTNGVLDINPAAGIAIRPCIDALGNSPCVAWLENGYIYAKHWNGTDWQADGGAAGGGAVLTLSLSSGNSTVYLAWCQNDYIYAAYLSGGAWQPLGGGFRGQDNSEARSCSLDICQGTPYIAGNDKIGSTASVLYVKHWNGSSWVQDGHLQGEVQDEGPRGILLTSANGVPYVAEEIQNFSLNTNKITLEHWNGSAWVQSCDLVVNNGYQVKIDNPKGLVASDDFFPYLAWNEYFEGSNYQVYVRHLLPDRISGVAPAYQFPAGQADVTVSGVGFAVTPTAQLLRAGYPVLTSTKTVRNNANSYTYTFDLSAAAPQVYDVRVVGADGNPSALQEAFSLLSPVTGTWTWKLSNLGQAGAKTQIGSICGLEVGDGDGDRQQELYVSNQDSNLYKFVYANSQWNFIAQNVAAGNTFGRLVLADGNHDTTWELYAGTFNGNHLFSCSSNWTRADIGATYAVSTSITALAQADLYQDGVTRIYAASTYGNGLTQFQYNGVTWTATNIAYPSSQPNALITGDGNNDGVTELYSANSGGNIYQYKRNGNTWDTAVAGTGTDDMLGVAVGDGENSGGNQVYAACNNGGLYQFRWNGAAWNVSNTIIGQVSGNTLTLYAVVVGDGENSGGNQVYVACGDGHVYEFKYQGSSWSTVDLGGTGTPLYALTLGDADNDHHLEIYALGRNNHVYQFKAAAPPTPTPSPTPYVTPTPTPVAQNYFKISHNQINPVLAEKARIVWTQAQDGPVTIVVYNLLGDRIITLVDNLFFPGGQCNEAAWDGKNKNGAEVGSGIYLVVLKVGGRKEIAKIAVIK